VPNPSKRSEIRKRTRSGPVAKAPIVSDESRLDILGVALVLSGVLTLICLLAGGPATIFGLWAMLLRQIFGIGAWILPLAIAVPGVYLVLRRFRSALPVPAPDRIAGAILLFLGLLMLVHLLTFPPRDNIVVTPLSGGLVGGGLVYVLVQLLDYAGAVLVIAAWLIVAVVLTFHVSVPEIVELVSAVLAPIAGFIRKKWTAFRARRLERTADTSSMHPYADMGTGTNRGSAAVSGGGTTDAAGGSLTLRSPLTGAAVAGASATAAAEVSSMDISEPVVTIGVPEPPPPWQLPDPAQILNPGVEATSTEDLDQQRAKIIEDTLASLDAPVKVVEINRGPTITQFGVEPGFTDTRGGKSTRIKVSKIAALDDDLALALAAHSIRIQAPVPGKNYVGIEVPNAEISLVALRDIVESEAFHKLDSPLRLALGKDVSGNPRVSDLVKMPHLLLAGTTGSGKSVCVNSIIACFLLHNTPDDLRLLMVDPKRVELSSYNGIPHLLTPVVVELDRVVGALQWVMREMDDRYRKFSQAGTRNIEEYNRRAAERGEKKLPVWVVIIDELADLMLMAPEEVERILTRIAQLSRATGIHMIIATQRPSVDVLTGLIKANFPARIAFAVASQIDSRVILDQPGADRLLGRGDMLFLSPDSPNMVRLQGAYVSEPELVRLVHYWRQAYVARQPAVPVREGAILKEGPGAHAAASLPLDAALEQVPMFETEFEDEGDDKLLDDAIAAVRQWRKASTTRLQRRFRIGYTRAARLMDMLEERGIIGPPTTGSQPREVIDYGEGEEDTG
jgi:S-DNA-T family DNA segregation ATPase FtsK/SpoIIIE